MTLPAATYTTQNGGTVPGAQVDNTTDYLSGVNGNIPATVTNILNNTQAASQELPNAVAQDQSQVYSQPNVQQPIAAYGDTAKLYQMFAADQNLAQQYMRPDFNQVGAPAQTPSDYPNIPGGIPKPELGVLTNSVIQQGEQGPNGFFTTPGAGEAQAQLEGTGIMGAINNLNSLIKFNTGQAASQVAYDTQNWKDQINQNLSLANLYMTLYANEKGTGTETTKQQVADLTADLQSTPGHPGMTLEDAMYNYANLGANTVYNLYNRINTPQLYAKGIGYGPAKQSSQELLNEGFDVTAATPTSVVSKTKLNAAQQEALKQTQNAINTGTLDYTTAITNYPLLAPYLTPI